jgi:hypothetical protein
MPGSAWIMFTVVSFILFGGLLAAVSVALKNKKYK